MFRKTTLLAALALTLLAPAQALAEKKCTNTYHPGGIRCTFCYYTTQPGSGSTVCIKLDTGRKNSGPTQSFAN
ncbi:MAG: hypothetical protein ACREC3_17465 [Methyloceanibacter sp.]